jgi:hypothetical protein
MTGIYRGLDAVALRRRAEGLTRHERWAARHPAVRSAAEGIAGVASLYELLPPESRVRAVDPAGVSLLHRALSVLSATLR